MAIDTKDFKWQTKGEKIWLKTWASSLEPTIEKGSFCKQRES